MNKIKRKLHSQKGETLVELMAAILIATLSIGLLIGGISVSVGIDRQGKNADKKFYNALTEAESQKNPINNGVASTFSIKVTEGIFEKANIPIQIYGDRGLYSYTVMPIGGDLP